LSCDLAYRQAIAKAQLGNMALAGRHRLESFLHRDADALEEVVSVALDIRQLGRLGGFRRPLAFRRPLLEALAGQQVDSPGLGRRVEIGADMGANVNPTPRLPEPPKDVLYEVLGGLSRVTFQMGVSTLPHQKMLRAIEILGAGVAPIVRKELAAQPEVGAIRKAAQGTAEGLQLGGHLARRCLAAKLRISADRRDAHPLRSLGTGIGDRSWSCRTHLYCPAEAIGPSTRGVAPARRAISG